MRRLLIGAGMASYEHPPHQGIVDPAWGVSPERAAKLYGDVQEAIADGPWDYATICTPTHLHWHCAEPLIAAGIPVLVEKPLCLHADDRKRFADAVAGGAKVGVVTQLRWSEGAVKLAQEIGGNGNAPLHLHLSKVRQRGRDYYSGARGSALDGGAVAQQGYHMVDLARFLLGPIVRASLVWQRREHDIAFEDTALLSMEHEGGSLTSFFCTTAARKESNRAVLTKKNGSTIEVDLKGYNLQNYCHGKMARKLRQHGADWFHDVAAANECAAWIERAYLDAGLPPFATFAA